MRRICVISLAALALVAGAPARAAAHTPARRVVVLWLDHTSFADWQRAGSNFRAVLKQGASGLLSVRTRYLDDAAHGIEETARETFAAGSRRWFYPEVSQKDRCEEGLNCALEATGLHPLREVGSDEEGVLCGPVAPSRRYVRVDSSYPARGRARYDTLESDARAALREASVLLVAPGDTARTERAFYSGICSGFRGNTQPPPADVAVHLRVPWIHRAMRDADRLLGRLRKMLGPNDLLMVVSTPSVVRVREGIRLGAVAIAGPGVVPGLLESPTTRRPGVVALVDLAPTILAHLGVPARDRMEGRPATVDTGPGALARVRALEGDLVHAARARRPLTRGVLSGAMFFAILAFLTVVAGRGRGRPRGILSIGLTAIAAAPLGVYVEGAFPSDTTREALAVVIAFALVLALLARAALGRERGLAAILLASALVPVADLVAGSPLAYRSAIAFQIAGGGRFFGVDEAVLGLVVGGVVVGTALALDRRPVAGRWAIGFAVALGAIAWILGAPSYGAKFGAALTAIPAFGLLAARAGGLPWRRTTFLAIAIAGVLVTGLVVLADTLRPPEAQTHVARAVSGQTDAGALLQRKLTATWRITAFTAWTPALLVSVGTIGALVWRRRSTFDRAMWGRPHLRAALVAGLVGAVAAIVFNDGGVVAAAMLALPAVAATFTVMLGPDS